MRNTTQTRRTGIASRSAGSSQSTCKALGKENKEKDSQDEEEKEKACTDEPEIDKESETSDLDEDKEEKKSDSEKAAAGGVQRGKKNSAGNNKLKNSELVTRTDMI